MLCLDVQRRVDIETFGGAGGVRRNFGGPPRGRGRGSHNSGNRGGGGYRGGGDGRVN